MEDEDSRLKQDPASRFKTLLESCASLNVRLPPTTAGLLVVSAAMHFLALNSG